MFKGNKTLVAVIIGLVLILVSHYALHLDNIEFWGMIVLLVAGIMGMNAESLVGLIPVVQKLIPALDDLIKLLKEAHAADKPDSSEK